MAFCGSHFKIYNSEEGNQPCSGSVGQEADVPSTEESCVGHNTSQNLYKNPEGITPVTEGT